MKRRHLLRAGRNLLLAGLAALLIWSMKGYPLPMEMDFRRYERQSLAERSEILWTYRGGRAGDRDMLVGLAADYVHVWHPNGYVLFWPRQEGGTLVSLPAETRYADGFSSYLAPALLVADPPEGADAARLTITLSYQDWSEDYVVEGERQGQVFFFQMKMRHHGDSLALYESDAFRWLTVRRSETLDYYPYTVEFFDTSGNLLSSIHQEGWKAEEVS